LDDLTEPIIDTLTSLQSQIVGISAPDLSGYQTLISDTNQITISNVNNLQTTLDGKQATLSNASYLDATSSVQTQLDTLTTNVADKQSTITDGSLTIARTSGLQTALDSKQNTLTNGSVSDSLLASTFVKPSTAPVLTGTNFTGIPTTAISSGSLTISSLITSGNAQLNSISEKFTNIGNNGTANSYTLDYTGSTATYILTTAPTANFTIRLNNCGSDTTKAINFAIIYNTTGKWYGNTITAYTDTSTQITLASATPLYLGGTPSISTSTIMVQTFSLIQNFASNYVITNVASYY
jgi:hypothetical protein